MLFVEVALDFPRILITLCLVNFLHSASELRGSEGQHCERHENDKDKDCYNLHGPHRPDKNVSWLSGSRVDCVR